MVLTLLPLPSTSTSMRGIQGGGEGTRPGGQGGGADGGTDGGDGTDGGGALGSWRHLHT